MMNIMFSFAPSSLIGEYLILSLGLVDGVEKNQTQEQAK